MPRRWPEEEQIDMDKQREKLKDSINDIANWLIRKPFKNELPAKVLEKLSDSLYSKTVIDAIEKDISIMLEAEKRG